jgi:AraC-like DNA-binding protein
MIRPTQQKRQEQAEIQSDVERFLAAGGEIEQVPGFQYRPKEVQYTPEVQYKLRNDEKARFKFNNRNTGRHSTAAVPEEINVEIDRLLKLGWENVRVARQTGVSLRTVGRRYKKLYGDKTRRVWTQDHQDQAEAMRKQGLTLAEISEKLNFAEATVCRRLNGNY